MTFNGALHNPVCKINVKIVITDCVHDELFSGMENTCCRALQWRERERHYSGVPTHQNQNCTHFGTLDPHASASRIRFATTWRPTREGEYSLTGLVVRKLH
jgi:hypothetical protein